MNAPLEQARQLLEAYVRETKAPRGYPPGTEFKTLGGPGVIVLGSSLDAGREAQARQAERFATYAKESRDYRVRKLIAEVRALIDD